MKNSDKRIITYTITCHNCYNYGSILQTYALQKIQIKNGINNTVINYIPYFMEYKRRYTLVPAKYKKNIFLSTLWKFYHFLLVSRYICRKKRFSNFSKKNIKLTKKYSSINELVGRFENANALLCGSDQIWNGIDYENGKDPAFFLDFSNSKNKIAYAASFGGANISEETEKNIKKCLPFFKNISVREKTGIEMLNKFNIKSIDVCDPVFLLKKEEWVELLSNSTGKTNFLLVYCLGDCEKCVDIINKYYKNYRIISIGEIKLNVKNEKHIRSAGPLQFLQLICDSDFILTDSFHCLAFSLLFEKNVKIFSRNIDTNTRLLDLCKSVEIEKKVFDYSKTNIDYAKVTPKILAMREQSINWLLRSIRNEKY